MKQRPYGPNGAMIDVDMELARDIYSQFETHFHRLPDFDRSNIQCILEGQKPLANIGHSHNFVFIWSKNLAQRARGMCETHNLEPAIAVGAFVWALNQTWASSIDIPNFMQLWGRTCVAPHFSTGQTRTGIYFLEHVLSIIDNVPKTYKHTFLTSTLDCLEKYATPWGSEGVNIWHRAHYLYLIGRVSTECSSSALHSWASNAALTLKNSTLSEKKLFASVLVEERLPREGLYAAMLQTVPEVWCLPDVHAYIIPILDANEELRLKQLSKSNCVGDGPARREMVQLYCPNVFQLLDLATAADDWEFPERLLCIVSGWKNQTQMTGLEIPQNIMEFP